MANSRKKQLPASKSNGSQYDSNLKHDLIIKIVELLISVVLSAFIGAAVSSHFTVQDNYNDEKEHALSLLHISYSDMVTQANLLEKMLSSQEAGEMDIETLRLNAPLHMEVVEQVLYDRYMIEADEIGAYSSIISAYRAIVGANQYLASDREASDDFIKSTCRDIIDYAILLSDVMNRTYQYNCGTIDKSEFEEWYKEYMIQFLASHPTIQASYP